MIGRAAVIDPWLIRRTCDAFYETPFKQATIPLAEKVTGWKRFAEMAVTHGVEPYACRAFRKFLVGIVKDWGLSKEVRGQAVRVETLDQIHHVLDCFLEETRYQTVAPLERVS